MQKKQQQIENLEQTPGVDGKPLTYNTYREKRITIRVDVSSKPCKRGRRQDGGGIGWGDHFLPYKFIERTTEC